MNILEIAALIFFVVWGTIVTLDERRAERERKPVYLDLSDVPPFFPEKKEEDEDE